MKLDENYVYITLGRQGIIDMIAAFYRKVPNDDILGPMYPKDDMAGAEERMRDFMLMRIGGETEYIEKRGHPRLRGRHMPFPIDIAARDRWLELMGEAMRETNVPQDVAIQLGTFFAQIADFMRNKEG